jgi:hypothetical protein
MKEIVIISCWPSTEYRENLLIKLINQLKELNKEILIASHYPVPDHIVNQVDYYIYDKTNTLYTDKTLDNYPADYYFKNEGFRVEAVNISHSTALSRIFNIALNFIKNLEYDYFTIMEADVDFNIEDLKKLDDIKLYLVKNNKELFFFKLGEFEYPYWENNGIFEVYETVCFGGFLKEFNSKLTFPKTLEEWNKVLLLDKNNQGLEYFVTNTFKKYKENYYILNSTQKEFSNSKINISTVLGIDGVYFNPKDENKPILFLINESNNVRTYKILLDDRKITLNPGGWWFNYLDISEYSRDIKVIVYEGDKIVKNFNLLIDKEWINREKNRRQILFK